MTVDLRSKADAHIPTINLYCPYDRKTTRHIRRESDGAIVCAECGRGVDLGAPSTASPVVHRRSHQAARDVAPSAGRRARHVADLRASSRPAFRFWLLLLLPVVVLGLVALVLATDLAELRSQASPTGQAPSAEGTLLNAERVVLVANTDGIGAFLRRTPQLEDKIRAWPDRTLLSVLGATVVVDGIEWSRVRDPVGTEGWIPTQYTQARD